MVRVSCTRLGSILSRKMSVRMRALLSGKASYKQEHVTISAFNNATSASDENRACLSSAGRPRRVFGGGGDVAVDARVERKRCALVYRKP